MKTTRRALLQGTAGVAVLAALGGTRLAGAQTLPAITVPLTHGPFQNNGATPWYAKLQYGTPGQPLKIALDTGSNFNWVTSDLCSPTGCQHYGNSRFHQTASSTFSWISQTPKNVDFGPWGTMVVETGKDKIQIPGAAQPTALYLAQSYSGPQFQMLDWDGGIGFPSGTAYADTDVSFFFNDLIDGGIVGPSNPYLSFDTDLNSGTGNVLLGGYDFSKFNPAEGIFMPYTPYQKFPNVEYIWSTPLANISVGGTSVASGIQFCLDSGSSQFKGDTTIMNTILSLVGSNPSAPVELTVGTGSNNLPGRIVIPPQVYNVLLQAGPGAGTIVPQFAPLGLTDLVLVGSVLMDYLYTIFLYSVSGTPGNWTLSPVGMYLFNKIGGPQLIQPGTSGGATAPGAFLPLGPQPVNALPPATSAGNYGPARGGKSA
jgi:hypothetical protein